MLFENDHNLIDTEIMKIEQEIEKITDMKSNLYQISSLDEFKNFRGNLGQFLFKFEEEISTIIYSLKSIQNINRKFYDNYAKNQNDFEDVLKQLEYYSNDNKMLINNLNLANKNIDYLNKINLNQEKYIEELIAKLQGKEIEYYGGIVTKKKNLNDNNNSKLNISEESNKLNYDYDNEKNMIQNKIFKDNNNKDNNNNKNLPNYMTNFINNKRKELNNNLEDNKSEDINNNINNNINKSDNISNINNTNSVINISNKESDNNTINQNINNLKLLENKILSNNNNNLLNEDKPDVLKYDKVWELFNKNKQNNINNEEENENKEKIDRIQDIVLKIFQNDEMMKYFKEKYGNNFENDILNEKVSNEFLKEIENEIFNYENNNKNVLNELNSNEEKKNISIPERDLNDELPTAKFKNKQNSNDILSYNSNNSNKKIEEESKFKNYFIFNLQREKMFQAQKERKKKNKN